MKKNYQVKLVSLLLAVLLVIGSAFAVSPLKQVYAADDPVVSEEPPEINDGSLLTEENPDSEAESDSEADLESGSDDGGTDEGLSGDEGQADADGDSQPGQPGEDGDSDDQAEDEGQSEGGGDNQAEDDGQPGEDEGGDDQAEDEGQSGDADGGPSSDEEARIPAGQSEPLGRIAGASRYMTAIEAAERLKIELGVEKFDSILIASGEDYADALSGSYLAYVKRGPILLVNNAFIETVAEYTLANLTEGGIVYILGGKAAVSKDMERALPGVAKKRLYGENRYITNVKILREAGVTNEDILVCSGLGFADSLSASATKRPILLVGTTLAPKQRDFLHGLFDAGYTNDFYIIGGRGAVNLAVEDQCKSFGTVTRIQGSNRYKTSLAVAEKFFDGRVDTVVLACGTDFPDGLTGGPIAASLNAPMLLVTDSYTADARTFARNKGAAYCVVMGGSALISDASAQGVLQ